MRAALLAAAALAFGGPAVAHDNYAGIVNREGDSCCNGQDCHAAFAENEFIIKMSGGYVLKKSGEFIPEKLVADSPDANWHICRKTFVAGQPVRCLMVPAGGY